MEIYFPATFEQMSIGIAYASLDGHWLHVNRNLCEMVGYTREELLAATFQSITHPEDLVVCLAMNDHLIKGDISGYTLEKRYIHKKGLPVWINFTVSLVHDENNTPQYLFGILEDIDERKRVETERNKLLICERYAREEAEHIQQQLRESRRKLQDLNSNLEVIVAQRTEALCQLITELQRSNQELQNFAYIASHDLQEPLRKIQAFGDLLEEEYGPVINNGNAYLDRMRDAAGRMRALIDNLLICSRVTTQAQSLTQVNLANAVHEVIDDLEPRLNATQGHIEVGELPIIEADPQQMYQLFQNLLVNAVKFHRPDVPPRVRVYAQSQINPVEYKLAQDTVPTAQQQYQIFIEDNGIGFDEKYLDHIFTVFQRLHGKSEYEGTGIGLAIVRKIVERHGWEITARSVVGHGTIFIMTLPDVNISGTYGGGLDEHSTD